MTNKDYRYTYYYLTTPCLSFVLMISHIFTFSSFSVIIQFYNRLITP